MQMPSGDPLPTNWRSVAELAALPLQNSSWPLAEFSEQRAGERGNGLAEVASEQQIVKPLHDGASAYTNDIEHDSVSFAGDKNIHQDHPLLFITFFCAPF